MAIRSILSTILAIGILTLCIANPAHAEEQRNGEADTDRVKREYARPFLLRAIDPGNMAGLDVSFAFAKPRDAFTMTWQLAKELTPALALQVRWGIYFHSPLEGAKTNAFLNPSIGVLYTILKPMDHFRLGFIGLVTLPISTAAGDNPAQPAPEAITEGVLVRSGMDNALFDANYIAPTIGVDAAWTTEEITAQAEITVSEHILARGAKTERDNARTNLTLGAHLAYFFIPSLSFGIELRYQRWLAGRDIQSRRAGDNGDTWTIGCGPRAQFRLGSRNLWLAPALSASVALDSPNGFGGIGAEEYRMIQMDLPLLF